MLWLASVRPPALRGGPAHARRQLLARKGEALLVRGNALLVLYHTLDHVDGVNSTCNTNSSVMVLPFSFSSSSKSSFIALQVSSCCFLIFLALTCSRVLIIALTAPLCFVFRISVEINVTAASISYFVTDARPLWAVRKSGMVQLASW